MIQKKWNWLSCSEKYIQKLALLSANYIYIYILFNFGPMVLMHSKNNIKSLRTHGRRLTGHRGKLSRTTSSVHELNHFQLDKNQCRPFKIVLRVFNKISRYIYIFLDSCVLIRESYGLYIAKFSHLFTTVSRLFSKVTHLYFFYLSGFYLFSWIMCKSKFDVRVHHPIGIMISISSRT